MPQLFKYTPADFGKLSVKVLHMDLNFDVYDEETHVLSQIKARALQDLKKLDLNAKELEIHAVQCDACPVSYVYDKEKAMLSVQFEKKIKKGKVFNITTKTM